MCGQVGEMGTGRLCGLKVMWALLCGQVGEMGNDGSVGLGLIWALMCECTWVRWEWTAVWARVELGVDG
eukprot:jgi/Botrbrau1/1348/Bobra.0063s0059.1